MAGNPGMQNLIPIVNKIQDLCTQTGIRLDLPQFAVVGLQSAGKSSVLEGFVGRDFLPRGTGIVTRRPLILQLINVPEGGEEYGKFLHCKDKKITDFNQIRIEIEKETHREAGTNKGIVNVPINLRIYSPNVLNLTLVDLPGITKVAVGDQPADIEKQIRNMILEYVCKPNCLILAVSAASADFATSEALKLAKEVNKNGTRTIGVITKLDLMDAGTDARDILENKLIPLHRGYIDVVNRSQQNIEDQKEITKALEDERDFFMQHNYYRNRADRLGMPYLQKILNRMLTEHIHERLPTLRDTLLKRVTTLKKEIDEYEYLHPTDAIVIKRVMLEAMRKLELDFQRELGSLGLNDINTDRFSCGAKIRRIFHKHLPNEIAKIGLDEAELRCKIAFAIENLYGKDLIMNGPFKVFEVIIRERISLLEQPIEECINLVIEELSKSVRICTQRILPLKPSMLLLKPAMLPKLSVLLPEPSMLLLEPAMLSAPLVLPLELFVLPSVPSVPSLEPSMWPLEPMMLHQHSTSNAFDDDLLDEDVGDHFELIVSYMQIVEKTTIDMIPKAITKFIIRDVEKFINIDLSLEIVDYFGTNIVELVAADPESIEQYTSKKKVCDTFKTALEEINQIGNA